MNVYTHELHDGTTIVTDIFDDTVRYVVWQDDSAESPNDWDTGRAYVYASAHYGASNDEPNDELSEVFYRVYSENHDDELALAVTRRYARVILGFTPDSANARIVTYSAQGYSQSHWSDILVITPDSYADSFAREYEMWMRGDVWVVMRETRIECDSDECHGDDSAHWEPSDSLGGIYADSAEDAVQNADLSALN